MSTELLKIILKETYVTWDFILLLVVPVAVWIATVIYFRISPLKADRAWSSVGMRIIGLGAALMISALLVYASAIGIGFSRQKKENAIYVQNLQEKFRDYYAAQKNYTQRLIDFAERIEDHKEILAELHNFAFNLPALDRETLGKTWAASRFGGQRITLGNAFDSLNEQLYWPEEKIQKYKKDHNGMLPPVAELRYTREQIEDFRKKNWSKLYPGLDGHQWKYITNQILLMSDRESIIGFLRDIADCYQTPDPADSLNALYERLADKACPTEAQKIECYLENQPQLLKMYKFNVKHRIWARGILLLAIFAIAGIIFCAQGKKINREGLKKNLFQ